MQGTAIYKVVKRLKAMKYPLKALNKVRFSNIEQEADSAFRRLIDCRNIQIQSQPLNRELHIQEHEARVKYDELNKARMSFLKQKVKQEWIESGNANTAYFHACLKKRRIHNHVCRLQVMHGN